MKRFFDLVISFLMLLTLLPMLIVLSLLILFKIGNPIFFIQRRPGLNGRVFRMIKFRTLTNTKDEVGNLLPESERLTQFGSFLRSTSLDELPELVNILKGDMSFVGPRPLRVYYMPLYNDRQLYRHFVRPGITGWAQVNGRNAISWEKKFELDVWYVENQSFLLDIKILWMTLIKVLKRENTTSTDGGFTEPFRGSGPKKKSLKEVNLLKQKFG